MKGWISIAIAVVTLLIVLPLTSPRFKVSIPVEFGFFTDNKIRQQIEVETDEPAKRIPLRFHNSDEVTLTDVSLDIRFYRPLALSGTEHALSDKTTFGEVFTLGTSSNPDKVSGEGVKLYWGPAPDNGYYRVHYSGLVMAGHESLDFEPELNTKDMRPGTYRVGVTAYSKQEQYKYKEGSLSVLLKQRPSLQSPPKSGADEKK